MAVPHVSPGESINLLERIDAIETGNSRALVKSDRFTAMVLQLPAGNLAPEHSVPGPVTVHCLKGRAKFKMIGAERDLAPGDWLFLEGGAAHSIEAVSDCALLVTIVFE